MLPAIDIDELAIDEAGHVGGQEDHHGADVVFRIARALERIAGGRHFQEAGHIVHQLGEHLAKPCGGDGVGADVEAAPFHRGGTRQARPEEHTSELQSLMSTSYAVFCLKKKKKTKTQTAHKEQ